MTCPSSEAQPRESVRCGAAAARGCNAGRNNGRCMPDARRTSRTGHTQTCFSQLRGGRGVEQAQGPLHIVVSRKALWASSSSFLVT
eukprot:gene13784-biopygen3544